MLVGSGCNIALKLIEGTAVKQLSLPYAVRGYLTTKGLLVHAAKGEAVSYSREADKKKKKKKKKF